MYEKVIFSGKACMPQFKPIYEILVKSLQRIAEQEVSLVEVLNAPAI